MLASDAAARGINLPWVSYIVEIEPARTHSTRMQRAGRGHRLGREEPLTFLTMIMESAGEGENGIRTLMARNADLDFMLGDTGAEGFTSAADRRAMLARTSPREAGT